MPKETVCAPEKSGVGLTQGVPKVGKVTVNHPLWHGRFNSYSWDLISLTLGKSGTLECDAPSLIKLLDTADNQARLDELDCVLEQKVRSVSNSTEIFA